MSLLPEALGQKTGNYLNLLGNEVSISVCKIVPSKIFLPSWRGMDNEMVVDTLATRCDAVKWYASQI